MLINLIACSIDRLQKLLKSFKAPMLRLDSTREKSFRNAVTVKLPSAGIDQVENKLSHMGRLERSQEGDITYYSSERGRIGRFGVYIIHLSVLVLAVGAMIGVLYGKRGILNLYEGESSSKFGLFYSRQRLDMGFKVTCDEVEVTRYASGEVEDYLSFLTIQRPGVQPEKIKLEVNRPYKSPEGFTLYQSDYGTAMILRIQDLESGRIHQARLDVESKDSISVPGTDMKVIIESFQDDRMYGPRLELRILHPDGFVEKPLLLLNYPAHDEKRPNARTKVTPAIIEYTGLQVGYDPGVWVVYVSFVLFMIGLCVAFFMPHRRLYARLEGKRLVLAGVTNKYSDSLEEKIKKIARELGEAGRKK